MPVTALQPNRGEKCGSTLTFSLTFEHSDQNHGKKCGPTLTFSLTFEHSDQNRGEKCGPTLTFSLTFEHWREKSKHFNLFQNMWLMV